MKTKGVILAELAMGDPGLTLFLINQLILIESIEAYGTNQQKEKYLPLLKRLDMAGQIQSNVLAGSVLHLKEQGG